MQRTVVIWDSCGEERLQFFVVEGRNIDHLNNKYINADSNTEAEQTEISSLVYDQVTFEQAISMSKKFPIEEVRAGASVIVCGFLP